ncbi:MAG: DnaA/Hda family protein [Paracoccus sp. (in: a-proteobacteria)]|nr:DnaA/Hda family protein [Paracoccus sp. (in: a-proteobacteria)]
MSGQLTFDLAGRPALGRGDFLTAEANRTALAALDAPGGWPLGRMLLLGPRGAGKSHLAAIWAGDHGARRLDQSALGGDEADQMAQRACTEGGAAVIEDVDRIIAAGGAASRPQAEAALFHLLNLCAARQCRLLLTARRAPQDWGVRLPDLASRLEATAQTRLGPPDEALLAAVLVKLFADRQLEVRPDLIEWLSLRMDRDLGLARDLVDRLDRAALAEKRPLTRRAAGAALDKLTAERQ